MKHFYSILNLAALICFISCSAPSDSASEEFENRPLLNCSSFSFQPSKYNIILIAGQSNTHSGTGLDSKIDSAFAGVTQLGRYNGRDMKVVKAIEPLDHHTPKAKKIGFSLTFANLFQENFLSRGDSIIIVPCGHGGTGFSDDRWNKGNDLYNDAVERVKYIQNKYKGSKLQAILWHQGERDINYNPYEASLTTFIENIRTDLQSPDVPFILGGMVPYWVNQKQSRIRQNAIIASIPYKLCNTGYADPTHPFTIEKENNATNAIHFNAAGQRELGQRYFSEYVTLIAQ